MCGDVSARGYARLREAEQKKGASAAYTRDSRLIILLLVPSSQRLAIFAHVTPPRAARPDCRAADTQQSKRPTCMPHLQECQLRRPTISRGTTKRVLGAPRAAGLQRVRRRPAHTLPRARPETSSQMRESCGLGRAPTTEDVGVARTRQRACNRRTVQMDTMGGGQCLVRIVGERRSGCGPVVVRWGFGRCVWLGGA